MGSILCNNNFFEEELKQISCEELKQKQFNSSCEELKQKQIKLNDFLDDKMVKITKDKKRMKLFLIWILSQKTNKDIMRMILSYLFVPSDHFRILYRNILEWYRKFDERGYHFTDLSNPLHHNFILFYGMDKSEFLNLLWYKLNEYDLKILFHNSSIDTFTYPYKNSTDDCYFFKINKLPVLLIYLEY